MKTKLNVGLVANNPDSVVVKTTRASAQSDRALPLLYVLIR